MNFSKQNIALVAIAIIAIGGLFFPRIEARLGQVGTRFPNGVGVGTTAITRSGVFYVGTSTPTNVSNHIFGKGALIPGSGLQTPGTVLPYDIAVTGVLPGDVVFAQFSTSSPSGTAQAQWSIVGADASTTAGFITVLVSLTASSTGAQQNIWDAKIGSSTSYQAQRR